MPWLKFVCVGIETSDKFRGEPAKGEEFGPKILTTGTEKGRPPLDLDLDFEEGFRKLKEGLRNA